MNQQQRIHRIGSALQQGASTFLILILFTLSLFVNISEAGWIHTEGEDVAVEFIYALQKGDLAEVNKYLEPSLLSDENQKHVQNALNVFPKNAILEITRTQINVNYNIGSEGKQEEFQFYIEMDNTALLIEEVLQQKGDQFVILGFHFNEAPMNMMNQFPFTMIHWVQPKNVFLAAGVFNAIFMFVVVVFLFVKPVKYKWLWLPVIFTGFAEASAQWVDDGPWSFTVLAVKYPSVWIDAATAQDPWSIVIALPVGAAVVLFLILTSTPEPEELTIPTLPQNGMPRRTQVQPRQRPRPQPTKVGR